MVVRTFTPDNDYAIIEQWWLAHGSYPPKLEHLSATGLLVEEGGKPICNGFLYKTDSKICVFEFVCCDPNADKKVRDKALDQLIKAATQWAKNNNFTLIYTSVNSYKYILRLEDNGFIEVDNNMTHMFYEV